MTATPYVPPGTPDITLTTVNSFGSLNGAVFQTGSIQPDPSCDFDTIVKIQHNGVEQGYNTDNRVEQFNENDGQHHSLLLANIPIVIGDGTNGTVEGVAYRHFVLNINDPSGNKAYLSLDKLQIWQEESGSLTNFTPSVGFAGAHTNYLAYDLDAGGNHWIGLKDGLSDHHDGHDDDHDDGHSQGDVSVLIPDSFFINDTAHRYVTLYSAFGQQSGWAADGGSEEWGVADDYDRPGTTAAIAASKTATVPGGTADQAGEVITYSVKVFNVGDKNLTGITVSDPSVSDLTRGADIVGNNDNILNAGETWSYTAHHTVTQAEIDSSGDGSSTLTNTVTVDSLQTAAFTASASVTIEQSSQMQLVKTASVPGGTADTVGELISYAMALTNNGTATLTNPHVDDSMINIVTPITGPIVPTLNHNVQFFFRVTNGDGFNLGDTNQNGVWDAGETYQFAYRGDIDTNGMHDPGETWAAINLGDANNDGIHQAGETWVGDANQNGVEDPGERWQFKNLGDTNNNHLQDPGETWQYVNIGDNNQNGVQDPGENWAFANAGDTNQNGVEDPGETFQFAFFNAGDTNQNGVEDPGESFQFSVSHAAPDVDANHDSFNDGDVNHDGQLNVGETWLYAFDRAVTQDDIDNGGVVNPGLTLDNTATATTNQAHRTATASVPVHQNPDLAIVKTADVSSVDAAGDVIHYTVSVKNTGNMTLTGLSVTDGFLGVGGLAYASGDADSDGKLDVNETWLYAGTHTVTQAEIDNGGVVNAALTINNTATADTNQTDPESASAVVAVLQLPHVTLDKTATVADGTADSVGDVISYAIAVVNDGNMTLTSPMVGDPSVSDLTAVLSGAFNAGDTDHDGAVDVGETWQYTASHTVTQSDMDAGVIANTASVSTGQGAAASDSASVAVAQNPKISLDKTGTWIDTDADGYADVGETVHYAFAVGNDGNVTLSGVALNDAVLGGAATGPASGDADGDGLLDVGETWLYSADHLITQTDVDAGTLHNTATVTAAGPQAQATSATDSADVTLPPAPPPPMASMALDMSLSQFIDIEPDGPNADPGAGTSGDLIQYIIYLNNTGNQEISGIVMDDPLLGGILGNPANGDADNDGNLDVGEIWLWDRNYYLLEEDVTAGQVVNEATATGTDPMANVVTATLQWTTLL